MRSGGATSVANTRDSDRVFKKPERWQTNKAKDGSVVCFYDLKGLINILFVEFPFFVCRRVAFDLCKENKIKRYI